MDNPFQVKDAPVPVLRKESAGDNQEARQEGRRDSPGNHSFNAGDRNQETSDRGLGHVFGSEKTQRP